MENKEEELKKEIELERECKYPLGSTDYSIRKEKLIVLNSRLKQLQEDKKYFKKKIEELKEKLVKKKDKFFFSVSLNIVDETINELLSQFNSPHDAVPTLKDDVHLKSEHNRFEDALNSKEIKK